jgi:hypothetical protein
MNTPLSARLRKAGQTIAKIGKEIEDSQIEDGDPPFTISNEQFHGLSEATAEASATLRHLTTTSH